MLISSKYSGRCRTCGGPIAVGDRVSWMRGRQGADHARCSEEGKAAAAQTEASRAVDADIDAPVPAGLAYLPYQRGGIAYAMQRKGTLFGDEMGLGKTIQAIGVINAEPAIRRVLVICPASLKINWARECQKWLVRKLRIVIANGKQLELGDESSELTIVIANYDVLKKHMQQLERAWDLLIVDEAQYIKNEKTQRTKNVHAIAERAARRIALTGTPIPNAVVELFSILKFVDPTTWDPGGKGFFRFAKRYCDAHREQVSRDKTVWVFSGSSNLEELQERLRASCMVRRLKADVLTELPAKRRQVIELPNENRIGQWGSMYEDAFAELDAEAEIARASGDDDAYASAVAKLRDRVEVAFTEMSELRHETALAKVDAVLEHVVAALDESAKIVVFAHHHDVIEKLRMGLVGYGAVVLTGESSMTARQAAVDCFQTDRKCRVFIGSITAAGVGLTLTAAAHVVFAELDWVPGNVSQAEDRCHRIGQRESVLVQHLVLDGSLDARIAHTIVAKQEVADAALDDRPAELAPVAPTPEQTTRTLREQEIRAATATITDEQIAAVHEGLQILAGMCDGAVQEDGMGFSKVDARFGHALAGYALLTPRQAVFGRELVRKYRRQLGDELCARAGVPPSKKSKSNGKEEECHAS